MLSTLLHTIFKIGLLVLIGTFESVAGIPMLLFVTFFSFVQVSSVRMTILLGILACVILAVSYQISLAQTVYIVWGGFLFLHTFGQSLLKKRLIRVLLISLICALLTAQLASVIWTQTVLLQVLVSSGIATIILWKTVGSTIPLTFDLRWWEDSA